MDLLVPVALPVALLVAVVLTVLLEVAFAEAFTVAFFVGAGEAFLVAASAEVVINEMAQIRINIRLKIAPT